MKTLGIPLEAKSQT